MFFDGATVPFEVFKVGKSSFNSSILQEVKC